MVVFTFFILDNDDDEKFFEENFFLADVIPNIVLGILLLTMSNININLQARDLQLRFYTIEDIHLTIKSLVDREE